MIAAALSAAVIGKVGLGMLRAYYILRVRAGETILGRVDDSLQHSMIASTN